MRKATIVITIPDITHEHGAEIVNDLDRWLVRRLGEHEYEIETNVSRRWLNKLRTTRATWGISTRESRIKAVS